MARTILAQHCCLSCRTARRRTGSGTRSRLPRTADIRGMCGSRGGCLGIDPRCRPTRNLDDSPIKTSRDLKGKKVAINAFGSSVDLALRVKLKKDGIDPRQELTIVEVAFPNQAAAIREKRVDCGILLQPFMTIETRKGGLRPLFTAGDALGPFSVVFQVATNDFLKQNSSATRSFLADYVRGLQWFYSPANRQKVIEMTAAFTKSPAELIDSYFVTERDYYRDPNACVGVNTIQTPIDAMYSEGLIDRPVKIAEHLNMSYLPYPCST